MLILIFQILYYLVFFTMFLMSLFIIFHIVFYSYTTISKIITLLIFVPVAAVLLFTNLVLFSALPLDRFFSGILP